MLVSIPRDSYVDIPGFGMNKINAAFDFGGPKLLAKTVQNATGLQINHYMGIGFGGLVNVVNAVGGVRMCIPSNLNDPASGLHLKKGCQNLDGAQALGFVRTRHLFATQDLQREQDQRVFIKALLSKMTSPGSLINPFASFPAAFGAADSLTVDKGTQLYQLVRVAFALRHPETTTVPIGSEPDCWPLGDVVHLEPVAGHRAVRRHEKRHAGAQEPDHRVQAGRGAGWSQNRLSSPAPGGILRPLRTPWPRPVPCVELNPLVAMARRWL